MWDGCETFLLCSRLHHCLINYNLRLCCAGRSYLFHLERVVSCKWNVVFAYAYTALPDVVIVHGVQHVNGGFLFWDTLKFFHVGCIKELWAGS